ncbi:MAG: hypothetical protein A2X48_24145 [Lentisphaerae bacterium GWF2_49_21]|nr:MAG: hypothetical protein A2X48_24145 [Lentisphaerae bacterium GWF2_49_21]
MNPLVMHFGSGWSFYSGIGLILFSVLLSFFDKNLLVKIIFRVGLLVGLIGIFTASIPLPFLPSIILVAIFFLLVLVHLENDTVKKAVILLKVVLAMLCVTAALVEGTHWIVPRIPAGNFDKLYVVGDSISAGIGFQGEKRWTDVIQQKYGIKTVNLAVGGAVFSTALSSADGIKDEKAFVLLEIGGNDILRRFPLRQFREDMEKLLKKVCLPGRTVVMFEVPLPPFSSAFCSVQRELCKKYGVYLVPRRVFSGFITGDARSADGLHLSNYGHERMADGVWNIVKEGFAGRK